MNAFKGLKPATDALAFVRESDKEEPTWSAFTEDGWKLTIVNRLFKGQTSTRFILKIASDRSLVRATRVLLPSSLKEAVDAMPALLSVARAGDRNATTDPDTPAIDIAEIMEGKGFTMSACMNGRDKQESASIPDSESLAGVAEGDVVRLLWKGKCISETNVGNGASLWEVKLRDGKSIKLESVDHDIRKIKSPAQQIANFICR